HPNTITGGCLMKKFMMVVALIVLTVGALVANDPKKVVENFTLEDYNGVKHSLSNYKDSKAIVLMFIATQCPVSNAYNARMVDLFKNYKEKDVAFIGINSNKQESVEEIKDHANKNGFAFTVLKDWKNVIADRFEASVTPEIYVLSSNLELLYHGRIDDSQRLERVNSRDLRAALDELLAGKDVSVASTKAFGCAIKRVN
ncbi:MAG: thioredoxin family protein, partial [Bacteroidota bacterium]